MALLKEIVRARPKPPHEVSPKVPLDLERIIQKALAATKADRYQTMDDLAVDLKRLARDLESGSSPSFDELKDALRPGRHSWLRVTSGIVGLAVVLGGAWALFANRAPVPDAHTILVVPMEVVGQTAGSDFIGRAFAEAIAVNLSQAKGLSVLPVPRLSTADMRDRDALIRSAQASGAARILVGTLTRDGSALHVTISLIDCIRNRLIWGAQADSDGESLASYSETLAREVSDHMGAARPRVYTLLENAVPDARLAASPDYLDAQIANRRGDTPARLVATERLVTAFPDNALAHTWRLAALSFDAFQSDKGSQARHKYDQEAAVLLHLDPTTPWVEFHRSGFQLSDGQLQDSILTINLLLSRADLAPDFRAACLGERAQVYSFMEDYDNALADLHEAVRLTPLNPQVYGFSTVVLSNAGRYEEALEAIRHSLALIPDNAWSENFLGYLLYALGKWNESLDPLGRSCQSSPTQDYCAVLAMALHQNGAKDEARTIADKAAQMPSTGVGLLYLADYWVLAHEPTRGLRLLRESLDHGGMATPADITYLSRWPDFADVRETAEFKAILAEARSRLPKN